MSKATDVKLEVISEDGEPATDGRVMIEAGSAQLDTPQTEELDGNNEVTIAFEEGTSSEVGLRTDRNSGTLDVSIIPPSNSNYEDALTNSEITVIRGTSAED